MSDTPKKKPARDLTDEEAIRRLFPKPVRDKARKEAGKPEKKPTSKRRAPKDS